MRRDLQNLLKQHKGNQVRFTTMLDLYALYHDFPDAEEARLLSPDERVKRLEDAFAADIDDGRFIPHVQLYEFETILFCDPDKFSVYYENRDREIAELKAIATKAGGPEQINDGRHSAPSKRIAKLFADYPDAKPAVSAAISEAIGVDVVRRQCPHFNKWLSILEALGGGGD
jgi:hypothetical protein